MTIFPVKTTLLTSHTFEFHISLAARSASSASPAERAASQRSHLHSGWKRRWSTGRRNPPESPPLAGKLLKSVIQLEIDTVLFHLWETFKSNLYCDPPLHLAQAMALASVPPSVGSLQRAQRQSKNHCARRTRRREMDPEERST